MIMWYNKKLSGSQLVYFCFLVMEWEEEEEEIEEMPKTKKKMNPAGNKIGCCSFLAYYLIDLLMQYIEL